jgi:GNAT superfamily N-acetyltransferase
MTPELVLAGAADFEGIFALLRAFYTETEFPLDEAATGAALRDLLSRPELGRVWQIRLGGELVGYAAVCFGFSLEHRGRDAFLDEIYLRPAARGRGVGRASLAFVEAACAELGVRILHLEVERDNLVGQALYRERGFADDGRMLLSKRLARAAAAPEAEAQGRPAERR